MFSLAVASAAKVEPKVPLPIVRLRPEFGVLVVRCNDRGGDMHISDQGILVILLVGLVAGWLAGKIVDGGGFGLIGDIAVGIVGALIGSWLMPRLGVHLASGILSSIIVATIGAVLLLVIVRLATGATARRRSWRW